jgi:glycerate 2-kinase
MKILLAPNSFKESLNSVTISSLLEKYLNNDKDLVFYHKPLSDGGDGFLKIINFISDVNDITIENTIYYSDYLQNCNYIYNKKTSTIYLESANLFGLKVIKKEDRNPLNLSSELLGKILLKFSEMKLNGEINIENVVVGVGGTATIDAGFGACSQLGLNLYNKENKLLETTPNNFGRVTKLKFNKVLLPFKLKFIVDVDTELIADPGAIEIYGKQKEASEHDLKKIKNGITNILHLIQRDLDIHIPEKLNGAGGGLASGFNLLYGSEIVSARKFIENEILKDIYLDDIDLVFSGEGSFDRQSFEGKGSGVILDLFKDRKAKIVLINGITEIPENFKLPHNLTIINISKFFNSKEESINNSEIGIKKAVEIIKSQFGL